MIPRRFRAILGLPGALAFSSAAMISRLPLSMAGLSIVVFMSQRHGSFGSAGLVAGAYVAAQACAAPRQARWADRRGQGLVLAWTAAVYAAGMSTTIAAISLGWPPASVVVAAAVAGGATPQAGSMARVRWVHVLDRDDLLTAAFSLESVVDEVVFVSGPMIVTLAAVLDPSAGIVLTAGACVVGTTWLALQRATEPLVVPGQTSARGRWIVLTIWPVVLTAIGYGSVFGSLEVAVVASAGDQAIMAGLSLALFALGSLLAGVAVGSSPPALSRPLQLRYGSVVLALLLAPGFLGAPLAVTAVAMLVAGSTIAPCMICLSGLVSATVEPRRLTEGLTWIGTGMSAGTALGAAAAGLMVDRGGADSGHLVAVVSAAATAAVAVLVREPGRPRAG